MEIIESKTIYLTVRLLVKPDCDTVDLISDMDYNFTHADILDTEIVDVDRSGDPDEE